MADDNPSFKQSSFGPDAAGYDFALDDTLQSVVSVRTTIPENALTAAHLGTERSGHGVIINDQGLILTIGYVITEAESVWIIDSAGNALSGHVVGYDQESGFGLVQALGRLTGSSVPIGSSESLGIGQKMLLAGAGGESQCLEVKITDVREFAGYWEYLLDRAIFTSPVHPAWGGAALLDKNGKLCGIGSLILQSLDADDESVEANMIIPIDLLPPILDELLQFGKRSRPPRPWMGWFVQETNRGLVVGGLSNQGPAESAGMKVGDRIVEIDNTKVADLPSLYRNVWNTGSAGVDIQVTVQRSTGRQVIVVTSVDRDSKLISARLH